MAHIVPSKEEIDKLPQRLTDGEQALLKSLNEALGDHWTIYVQPHLNGLRPDFVIFSEEAGIGIFEVKDWNLNFHRATLKDKKDVWEVQDPQTGNWYPEHSPLEQARNYRTSIINYELPILQTKGIIDKKAFALVSTFVYFHKHTTKDIHIRLAPILGQYDSVFGVDSLGITEIRRILSRRNLRRGSKYAEWMRENELSNRLKNALNYPNFGNTNIEKLNVKFTSKQKELLPNSTGSRRVLGAAGSGKTLLLAHKAVNAAIAGKQVLLVCYNITMVNYLKDLVNRLARFHNDKNIHRKIQIGNFHRWFPDEGEGKKPRDLITPIDVLLIDEGQDFERKWIETLLSFCGNSYHFMFAEDDRQDIYERSKNGGRTVPTMKGRPSLLSDTRRVPLEIAKLGNALIAWSKLDNESGDIGVAEELRQYQLTLGGEFNVSCKWLNNDYLSENQTLSDELLSLVNRKMGPNHADIAILVSTVRDGWLACDLLKELSLPFHTSFESREENHQLQKMYPNETEFRQKERSLRRAYKASFWMQRGGIKVCTIHSFKGWELSHIFVLFRSTIDEGESPIRLLYTAITRSQRELSIYNADSKFDSFLHYAEEQQLLTRYS